MCMCGYVSERMCERGPCGLVQALGNWLCLCSRPFMDHRPLLAHFPAHTRIRAHPHTHTQSSQQLHPSPLLPTSNQTQLPGNKEWNKRERERSKGKRREQRQGNELTRPQEVEINKYEERVSGWTGSPQTDKRNWGSTIHISLYHVCQIQF